MSLHYLVKYECQKTGSNLKYALRTWSFGSFLDDLCMEMIGYMRLGTPGWQWCSASSSMARLQCSKEHFPERPPEATTNNRCVVCQKKSNHYAKQQHPAVSIRDNPFKKFKTSTFSFLQLAECKHACHPHVTCHVMHTQADNDMCADAMYLHNLYKWFALHHGDHEFTFHARTCTMHAYFSNHNYCSIDQWVQLHCRYICHVCAALLAQNKYR